VLCLRFATRSAKVLNNVLDLPGIAIERDNLRCRLWLKAVQPVKEIHQHLECTLLSAPHCFAKTCPSGFYIWVIFEPEVLPLEGDGVVEEEKWSVSENCRGGILGEVKMKRA